MPVHDSNACKMGWLSFKMGRPWLSVSVCSSWPSSQSLGGGFGEVFLGFEELVKGGFESNGHISYL
jgi:hypothetical protein